jgi:excisionase family DNA binding protein
MSKLTEETAKRLIIAIGDLQTILSSVITTVDEQYGPVMSVNEAAAYCGVARQTISDWVRKGKIRKVERGFRVGFLQSDLDRCRPVRR